MEYLKQKNKIIIKNLNNFNIKHILECGQVFRYENCGDYYLVISDSQIARIFSYANETVIECTDENYFENYFDLKTDYSHIKQQLSQFEVLKNAMEYGGGIRILRQDKLEMFISFIISANNNIKRIQNSIKKLSEKFGTKINSKQFGDYYAFPTLEQLNKITEQDFLDAGVGYRAVQLVKFIKQLNEIDLEVFSALPTEKAINELIKLSGIGPKVADCVLLFGYYKMDVFPVDTWIEKIYNNYFSQNAQISNRTIIRKNLTDIFTKLSGYAQQYLFYYERQNKNSKKSL
ncbi:MAG: DNA glycosylase [Clostridia bacterium]|nr:DNA glycosylase [Clostridia bacterium]